MRTISFLTISIITLIALLSFAGPSTAQLTVQWERLLSGQNGVTIGDITELTSGKYLVSHSAGIYPLYNSYLSEIGSNGAILRSTLWPDSVDARFLESTGPNQVLSLTPVSGDPGAFCMLTYPDGVEFVSQFVSGYIIKVQKYQETGFIASSYYGDNATVMSRFDSNGLIIWTHESMVGQYTHTNDVCSSVTGNIYMPVSGYPNMFIEKFDQDGNLLNEYSYPDYRNVNIIKMLREGNLFLSLSSTGPDVYLAGVIFDPDGNLLREYIVPEIENAWDADIWLMPDGGFLTTTVRMDEYPDQTSILFDRYDASYSHLWQYDYDNYQQEYYYIYDYDVLIDSRGDILLFGQADDVGADEPEFVFLSKFTPDPTDLEIAVDAYGDVSAVPAPGRFYWHGTLTNNTDADIVTDVWVIVRGPDGYPSEPMRVWEDITVPANGFYEADLRQNVPADAANGEYNYILRAGTYEPGNPQHTIQAYFPLTVTGGTEVNLDPPRVRGVVAAPFDGPAFYNPNTLRKWKP